MKITWFLIGGLIISATAIMVFRFFLEPGWRIAPTPFPSTSQKTTSPEMPIGILAVKEYKDSSDVSNEGSFSLETYKNSNITGISFRIFWKDLEPSQGRFNWNILDEVFRQSETNGKWVRLIIVPGFESPDWVLQDVPTVTFDRKYGKGADQEGLLPIPWDQTYLGKWFVLLKAVSARYGSNPVFKMIAAAGPTSVSAEMSLPNSVEDIQKWIKLGYTPAKYIEAWDQVFKKYSQIFPNQYIGLALYPGLPINDQGKVDQSQKVLTRQAVIDKGLQHGKQFTLQTSGLNASKDDAEGIGGYDIVLGYNGEIITGFQMSTSATRNPEKMGDARDPVNALKLSIDKGLQLNTSGRRIRFLEIYEPDILNLNMQSVLESASRIFTSQD